MLAIILAWLVLFQPLTPDTPQVITLEAYAGAVDLEYTTSQPVYLTVEARSLAAEPVDVTLEILAGTQRLAFSDDHDSAAASLLPTDALVPNLRLPEVQTYTLRMHSFSGAQSGEVEVTVREVPLVAPCETPTQKVELARSQAFTCTLDLREGQAVYLTARAESEAFDPVLALLDATGGRVVFNDDHSTNDAALNTLDAVADFTADSAGVYTVHVSDFAGKAGNFNLLITITP